MKSTSSFSLFTSTIPLVLISGMSINWMAFKAKAEGGDKPWKKTFGANRSVRSKRDAYVEITGDFSCPVVPSDDTVNTSAGFYNTGGHKDNPNLSQPTFFLGGGGLGINGKGLDVDAGLQYKIATPQSSNEGWEGVMSFGQDQAYPWERVVYVDPATPNIQHIKWEEWRGHAAQYTLKWKVWTPYNRTTPMNGTTAGAALDGAASLTVDGQDGVGEFFFSPTVPFWQVEPPEPYNHDVYPSSDDAKKQFSTNTTALKTFFVKREIGITQRTGTIDHYTGKHSIQDGTTFTCTFSSPSNALVQIVQGQAVSGQWDKSRVDQVYSGYDMPQTGDAAYDALYKGARVKSISTYIVDFPAIDGFLPAHANLIPRQEARTGSNASPDCTEGIDSNNNPVSRYLRETVQLSLRKGSRPFGQFFHPAGSIDLP